MAIPGDREGESQPWMVFVDQETSRPFQISHFQDPFTVVLADGEKGPERLAAAAYLRGRAAQAFGIIDEKARWLEALTEPYELESLQVADIDFSRGTEFRTALSVPTQSGSVVAIAQTHFAVPIWEAGIVVPVQRKERGTPYEITSCYTSYHDRVDVRLDSLPPTSRQGINERDLADALGLDDKGARQISISEAVRPLIYRFDPAQRTEVSAPRGVEANAVHSCPPPRIPSLRPLPSGRYHAGCHYVVMDVSFVSRLHEARDMEWRAFIAVDSNDILYLRAHVACAASGLVYLNDPATTTGDARIRPNSPAATLDRPRVSVALAGLNPPTGNSGLQDLAGTYVKVEDIVPPRARPPRTLAPFKFDFSAGTNEFAAVSAYYHCDAMFRLVDSELGLPKAEYFQNTAFPVQIDHRARVGSGCPGGRCINARVVAKARDRGIKRFEFARADLTRLVGIAADPRIVWHEFGHALSLGTVSRKVLGVTHSIGDALAAIHCDPGPVTSPGAPDRFLTFPWVKVVPGRRHDRPVEEGWGFGGSRFSPFTTRDPDGYIAEQIFSTTLFRLYCSLGGDSRSADERAFAARHATYLIVETLKRLGPGFIVTANQPLVFAETMIAADIYAPPIGLGNFRTLGGAATKAIRWSFERQGLYQPPGAVGPVRSPGAPPPVDVYIDEARRGEYAYPVGGVRSNSGIWVRHQPDAQPLHQSPRAGRKNFVYVRLKNRGHLPAGNVRVRGFVAQNAAALLWPGSFTLLQAPAAQAPATVLPGGELAVGPFTWHPTPGDYCLLFDVSADGDLSNIDPLVAYPCAAGPIAIERLVPLDNNIGARAVTAA